MHFYYATIAIHLKLLIIESILPNMHMNITDCKTHNKTQCLATQAFADHLATKAMSSHLGTNKPLR